MKSFFKCLLPVFVIAYSSLCAQSNIKEVRSMALAPAIGPYSQAVEAGSYLFVSGQLAIDPISKTLIGTTIEEQTSQVLSNIEAILRERGLAFANIVKTEVYLKDLNDFKGMNSVYAEKLTQEVKPARQAMQVARLPLDALIEISCIAFIEQE